MVLLALLPVQAVGATGGSCARQAAWGAPDVALAQGVLKEVNGHRSRIGLAPLSVSLTLTRAAEFKAAHMAAEGYLSHNDPGPSPRTVAKRLSDCGYIEAVWAENLGKGYATAQAAVAGWLGSVSGHKENIENAAHTHVGIGVVAAADGSRYWTQDFGIADSPAAKVPAPRSTVSTAPQHHQLITIEKSVPRLVTKRSGLLRKRRTRSMRLRAARGARSVTMSVRVTGKGWTTVKIHCAGKTVSRRARTRRPAKVKLVGVKASRCKVSLRSSKKAMRYKLRAVSK